MTRADQTEIRMRIVIDEPVVSVAHSLQSKDGGPLDATGLGKWRVIRPRPGRAD